MEQIKGERGMFLEIPVTEHQYYDYLIRKHEDIEDYEECAKLLVMKNASPKSDEKNKVIIVKRPVNAKRI
jgi:hypothetical protein